MAWNAGHYDWQRLQEGFDAEGFEWWLAAYYELGLDGWAQAAGIAAAAHNAGAYVAATKGMEIDIRKPDDFRDNLGDKAADHAEANANEQTLLAFRKRYQR